MSVTPQHGARGNGISLVHYRAEKEAQAASSRVNARTISENKCWQYMLTDNKGNDDRTIMPSPLPWHFLDAKGMGCHYDARSGHARLKSEMARHDSIETLAARYFSAHCVAINTLAPTSAIRNLSGARAARYLHAHIRVENIL